MWSPLGESKQLTLALAVFGAELIAGGDAPDPGSSSLARWDGASWHATGDGLDGAVIALAEHEGQLVIGGGFTTLGDLAARSVARWDGENWSGMGGGLPNFTSALAVLDGELVAARDYGDGSAGSSVLARWNGSAWTPFGTELSGRVLDLLVYNGDWIVGGFVGTRDASVAESILRWDGTTWSALGGGVLNVNNSGGRVSALAIYNGELIAGGTFLSAGGVAVNNIARWNGTSWSPLGDGLTNDQPPYAIVNALIVYNGELIAGGWFAKADGAPVGNIARWNGTGWSALASGVVTSDSTPATVRALTIFDGALIVGGHFGSAGGVPANNIARWDGTGWSALGGGVTGVSGSESSVQTLAVYKNQLVVGGSFMAAGGWPSSNLARWGMAENSGGDSEQPGGVPIGICGVGAASLMPLTLLGTALLRPMFGGRRKRRAQGGDAEGG
jgi:hypothetical protein